MACLLEKLSNENGVSGNEGKIRDIIIEEISTYADDVKTDTMGNVIAFKRGKTRKKLMVTAHMDEPGFIVSDITEGGYLKFKSVGKTDPRVIVSKRVRIGDKKVKGIIGMKAVHLQKKAERENTVSVSDLFIDIGAKNKADAEKSVSIGDYIAFDTIFADLGEIVKGKALDSRIGCECLIELLKRDFESDFYAVFAAQSEIEGRGANAAAYGINPDTAVIIGALEAADMFGVKPNEKTVELGKGAVVISADKPALYDKELTDKIISLAKKRKIKLQLTALAQGAYDGGAVQAVGNGAAVVNIAVPVRYSRAPVCMASKSDIKAVSDIIELIVKNGGETD